MTKESSLDVLGSGTTGYAKDVPRDVLQNDAIVEIVTHTEAAVKFYGAREVLDQLEREHRVGIALLGRPYHHDPVL